ncbi:71_t:CDS:2, partial [Cetraspora pellucida]
MERKLMNASSPKNKSEKHEIVGVSVYHSPTKDRSRPPTPLIDAKENSPHVPEIDHKIEFLSREMQEVQLDESSRNLKPLCKNDIYQPNNTHGNEISMRNIFKTERFLYNNKEQESEIMELLTICEQTRIYSFQEFLGL